MNSGLPADVALMAAWARAAGDHDALIALARGTCTSARDRCRIAELYMEQGNPDEALE